MKKLWIPLLVLVVAGGGAFTVSRLHGIFGSDKRPSYADTNATDSAPYNSKSLKYEVFGSPGTKADISYFDIDSNPKFERDITLPWSLQFDLTQATAVGSIMAQGDSNYIGCRIVVDDEVKSEKVSNSINAFTSCLLKAA